MGQYTAENAAHAEAARAIEENLSLLDPERHKAARNMTIALAHIIRSQDRMAHDMDLLHRKMQPILKYLEEENADWRTRYPNYEGG